ncbi:MAG: glycosyltransferase family 4 protein [Planctomycetaceae bacterium]|nr:glycosyltransferase family 4 protein [Planctomycetaceae bacterium]
MHVVFLSEHFHKRPSGPRKACLELARAMEQQGHRVSLIGMAPRNEDEAWTGSGPACLRRYAWRWLPVRLGRPRFFARELARLHAQSPIDAVLAMGLEAGAAALRFRAQSGVPYVLNPRSYLGEAVGHPKFSLARRLTDQCNGFIALSPAACKAWFARLGSEVPGLARGIFNGCTPGRPSGPPTAHREPMILSVGMLRRTKGHHLVIRALAELKRQPWTLLIAGDGKERAHLERDITRLGLTSKVKLAGLVDRGELDALYGQADFFCLFPIYFEACGNAFLEAMAAGLPIVASQAGGVPEVLATEHGRGVRLVPLRGAADVDEDLVLPDLVAALADQLAIRRGTPPWTAQSIALTRRAETLTWQHAAQGYIEVLGQARLTAPQPLRISGPPRPPRYSL